MAIRAAIFDLDCTLTCRPSTMKLAARRIGELYADYLHPDSVDTLESAMRSADGHGYRSRREFFTDVLRAPCWKTRPNIEELIDWWFNDFGACNVLHSAALPMLNDLRARGLKLGLITNGPSITQQSKIRTVGIAPLFDHIVIGGEFGADKPDPSIFRHSCQSLGVEPAEAVYIGDHAHNDVVGAEAVGLHAIWITTGGAWPTDLPKPDRQVDSLAEVPGVIAAL